MTEIKPEQKQEIRTAYREIYQQFYDRTKELFGMYENRISGLEDRVRNPAYDINGNGHSEKQYLHDFPSFYQVEGVQFLMDQKRVLIADEMGVGKTAQAIAGKIALENKLGEKVKTLVICPNRQVKSMWTEKLKEYVTAGRYDTMKIENIESPYDSSKIKDADVVLIDYHSLSFSDKKPNNISRKELKKKLMEAGFRYVVLDEAHNVKNYDSATRFNHVNDLASKAEYLCLLSGTSIPTNLKDIYSLIALLKPEHIDESGNKVGYKNASAVATEHTKTPSVVGAILRASRLERKLENVADMPMKTEEYVHIASMSPEQKELYELIYEDDSLMGLQKIEKLQQALLNPSILNKSIQSASRVKYEKLDEIVNQAIERGEKIVIYSPKFTHGVVGTLRDRYSHLGAVFMDGSNNKTRNKVIEDFQKDSNMKVMVMNKVGGEGIPLTAANNLVFLWEPYSPGERRQVVGRVWRPGQKKPVKIFTLNVDDTIDDGLRDFLTQKRIVLDYVYKGLPLTPEQRMLVSGENSKALERWLSINHKYIYTPSQVTGQLINRTKEKPEEVVVKRLDGQFGQHLAESLNKSWEESILENCSQIYSKIARAVEQKEGKFERMIDIASGFGGLSHSLQRRGIHNVDADKHHFNSPYASQENINLVGKMTSLPITESKSFDFALCSMALDILPNSSTEPGRVKAIAEANRILKDGGYYVFTLPASAVPEDDKRFREGIQRLGFETVSELTGFVKSKDKKINSQIYVLTAKKNKEIPESQDMSSLTNYFELNASKIARKKGNSQRRRGKATEFNFARSDGTIEDLEDSVQRFLDKEEKAK